MGVKGSECRHLNLSLKSRARISVYARHGLERICSGWQGGKLVFSYGLTSPCGGGPHGFKNPSFVASLPLISKLFNLLVPIKYVWNVLSF